MTVASRLRSQSLGVSDPASVSGLVVRLRAGDLALADGAAVATWTDTVSSLAFAQATGTKQPTYQATAFHGGPCVRFDGTDDFLAVTSTAMQVAARTIFVACRSGLSDITVASAIFSWDSTGGYVGAHTNEAMRLVYRDGAAGAVTVTGTVGSQFADTQQRLALSYTTAVSGSDVTRVFRKNGAERLNSASAAGAQVPATNTLRVGSSNGSATFFNGDIAEVLAYSRALTAAERLSVERYLGVRYGITVG